jgi:para-aminobenzoate synthetase/4-amino-4-deoxychorismate lyase
MQNTSATIPTPAASAPSRREVPDQTALSQFARQAGFVMLRDGAVWRIYRDPKKLLIATDLSSLNEVLFEVDQHIKQGGEAAGILNYELGYALEPRLHGLCRANSAPLCWLGLYDSAEVCNVAFPEEQSDSLIDGWEISLSPEDYQAGVEAIRRLIEAGEVYQVNFTTRLCFRTKQSAWETFVRLFRRHPVPHAAFLNTGTEQIVSLSPELFFRIENRRIMVKPMKGTAARGRFLEEDLLVGEKLRQSQKDRAENVMIVDLMRNDLGRICRTGSIKTTELFNVDRFPSVWQMTSTIEGELKENQSLESLLTALFPSGSVTGAPKIRAMEHINRLENSSRAAYTGAIGFLTSERALFNVAIRTLELQGEQGRMGIGSGITYDSDASAEWEECKWKAAFLTDNPPEFKLIETMYWEDSYRLLDAHLARMRDSAKYFDFVFDEESIRFELGKLPALFRNKAKRVRMALSREGQLEITHTDFVSQRFGRVGISEHAVHSQDRFLFHKTTNREVYERALVAARKLQLDDFLFFNENGELTEGTIHNVFLLIEGVWKTPAVTCGLLPGTFRSQVLRDRGCGEALLHLDDVKKADSIFLCNSVRGIFPVKVDWNAGWSSN